MATDNGETGSVKGSVRIVDPQGNTVRLIKEIVNGVTYYRMPFDPQPEPSPLEVPSEPQPARKTG